MRSPPPPTAQCSRCGGNLVADVWTRGGQVVVELEPCDGCIATLARQMMLNEREAGDGDHC